MDCDTLQRQKEADFLEAFDKFVSEQRKSGIVYKTTEACKIVASMPAPRFYVLPKNAMQRINEYRYSGKLLSSDSGLDMYNEIYRRFVIEKRRVGNKVFNSSIIASIVESEAPCWYLKPSYAKDLYYRAMKHRREKARQC